MYSCRALLQATVAGFMISISAGSRRFHVSASSSAFCTNAVDWLTPYLCRQQAACVTQQWYHRHLPAVPTIKKSLATTFPRACVTGCVAPVSTLMSPCTPGGPSNSDLTRKL